MRRRLSASSLPTSYSVVQKINYDGVAAPKSTGGIEQPVWDGPASKFYIAIPATAANANGEIDELDPQTLSVTRSIPSACKGPSGLVLIPGQREAERVGGARSASGSTFGSIQAESSHSG